MNKIDIGKIVGTHGIKGEFRILSDFPYKEKAFRTSSFLIIDEKRYQIKSYRKHKKYDMITLEGYTDINEVLCLINKNVYKEKEDLNLEENEILDSELKEYKVRTTTGNRGSVKEIFFASPTNKIMRVELESKEILIPFSSPFIKKIDSKEKEILIEVIEGM